MMNKAFPFSSNRLIQLEAKFKGKKNLL